MNSRRLASLASPIQKGLDRPGISRVRVAGLSGSDLGAYGPDRDLFPSNLLAGEQVGQRKRVMGISIEVRLLFLLLTQ